MNNFLKMINESAKYGLEGNVEEIYNLGEINIIDIKKNSIVKINTADIIRVVNDAMFYMQKKYPYLYLFLNRYKIMYVPVYPSDFCNTMQVDTHSNLWINMNFVYNECAMNKDRVFGILFHEMFHIFLEHLIRFSKKFPKEVMSYMSPEIFKSTNMKANFAMDYEINASMVADDIVSEDFFKNMHGLYKKKYTGKTWEEIYDKFGDEEYREWLDANGKGINEDEMKILEAIEKAAKVLKDPTATDEDKAKANKELQKTIDKILGRDREDDIQDILQEMKDTRLGEIGDIGEKMQDVIDDLYKNPSKMSENQFNDLMEDIDKMADEMIDNAHNIADTFNKSEDDAIKDIENMRQAMKDSISKMRDKKMTKEERKDISDKIKDSLEDIISSDVDKKRSSEKRKERDEKKEKERKEAFKEKHPLRKLINVFKNLMNLGEEPYDLVCEKSYEIMQNIVDILDVLTEVKLSEIKEDDVEDLKLYLSQLKDSLFTDLKKLLDNKTILHKTEDDLHRVLNGVFEVVEKALFEHLLNPDLNDDSKASVLKTAASKLRIIGKILKTQKAWRASDEFKEGYREMRDELMALFKKDKKATLKKLYDMGLLDDPVVIMNLDKRSKALFDELIADGEIK
jgi:Fe-S cluster biosynthesis and repair protein YggX